MQGNLQPKRNRLYDFFAGGSKTADLRANPNAPRNLKYFFALFGRRFWQIVYINLLLVAGNFPAFFAIYAFAGFADKITSGPTGGLFAQLNGMLTAGGANPTLAALFGVYGVQGEVRVPTVATFVLYGIAAVGLLLTFGIVNAGCAHLLRSLVRESPLFFWSDFFDTIRKNWKQAIPLGVLDLALSAALIYNLFFYYANAAQTWGGVMFYFTIFICFFFFIMRFYLYQLLITFRLSLRKIFKNALLFVMIGMKRNLLGLLGIVLTIFLNLSLLTVFYPLGLMMPLFLTIGLCAFIATYASYPKIKEIMIDPYVAKTAALTETDADDSEDDEEDVPDDTDAEDQPEEGEDL